MPEQDDNRSLLFHACRMTVVSVDLLELIALPTARRLAEADVEGAAHVADSISAALGRTLAMEAPLQLRQALADLLFDDDDAVDKRQRDVGV